MTQNIPNSSPPTAQERFREWYAAEKAKGLVDFKLFLNPNQEQSAEEVYENIMLSITAPKVEDMELV